MAGGVESQKLQAEEMPAARARRGASEFKRVAAWAVHALAFAVPVYAMAHAYLGTLPTGLSRPGAMALAIAFLAVVLWLTRPIPSFATALLVVALLSALGVMPFDEAAQGLGSPLVWLLFSTFIVSHAMETVPLGRRLALSLLRRAGGNNRRILLASYGVVLALPFLVPTSAGRTSLVLPVLTGLTREIEPPDRENFGRSALVGASYLTTLGGYAVMTGAGASIYASGLFGGVSGVELRYGFWTLSLLPGVVLFTLFLWLGSTRLFPLSRSEATRGHQYVSDSLRALGPLKAAEWRLIVILALMVLGWLTEPWHGFSVPLISLLGSLAITWPGMGILDWPQALERVRWDVLIQFGGSISLADALIRSGAVDWVASRVLPAIHPSGIVQLALATSIVVAVVRLGFVNVIGYVAIILPLALATAEEWQVNPLWFGFLVLSMAAPGFWLPSQTPANMITFGTGLYSEENLLRVALWAGPLWMLVVLAEAFWWWPVLGLTWAGP